MASGEKFQGGGYCRKVVLCIQRQKSEVDLLVVPLGEPQIVSGTVWPRSLGPTIWNFSDHTLKYWKEGKSVLFQGVHASELDVISRKLFNKLFSQKMWAYAVQVEEKASAQEERQLPEDLKQLLQEFQEVFQTLQGLPPKRSCDHQIPLLQPDKAVKIRPYHYPFH